MGFFFPKVRGFIKGLVVVLIILLFPFNTFGQVTSEGKDFWVGFFDNSDEPDQALEIYLISSYPARVVLETPLGTYSNIKQLVPGEASLVILPRELRSTENGVSDNGIRITSDQDISVYAINKRFKSADASTIFPSISLGTEYYAMAHAEPDLVSGSTGSNLVVVATENNSQIEVVPTADMLNGWKAGESHILDLNMGQTFDMRSVGDLTGTYLRQINGSKGFALFGGSEFTNVSNCGVSQDHLYEQVPPLDALGRKYLPIPFINRNGGDMIKIVAPYDETVIKIDGYGEIELNASERFTIIDFDEVKLIEANKPILVSQLSKSSDCDNASVSDPFLINLAPLHQRVKSFNFSAFNAAQIQEYYITIVSSECSTGKVLLDGTDVTGQLEVLDETKYGTFKVTPGDHRIDSDDGVLVNIYGYGVEEAYGYMAGIQSFSEEANLLADGNIIEPGLTVCAQAELNFDLSFLSGNDPLDGYDTFVWDFGDGTSGTGLSTTHSYEEGGEYNVILYVSDGQHRCANLTFNVSRRLKVSGFDIDGISGSQSVCEFASGIEYSVAGPTGNSYQWFVDGGTITSGNTSERVAVDWNGVNLNAQLKLLVQNSIGCIGDTLYYAVEVENKLSPTRPFSTDEFPQEACENSGELKTYSVLPTNGSVYQWFINSNGVIEGSSTGSSVKVNWTNSGIGELWYTESNPAISDCEGLSDILYVTIYEQFIVDESIVNPTCYSNNDGEITLGISGGKQGNYQVLWGGGLGNSTSVDQLGAGQYTVTVQDEIGCEVVKTINLVEPNELELVDTIIQQPLCFQDDDGQVQLSVVGGTTFANSNYRYSWSGNGLNKQTTEGFIGGLSPGNYTVTVTDAQSCSLDYSFEIKEATELAADMERLMKVPTCPGLSNGRAYIEAKGGTPDYQFYWSNKPTIDDKNGSDLAKGIYTVRIVDASGCQITQEVRIDERQPKVFIPNAFSPNADGSNDVFKPVADCALTYAMQIYNKWGAVIFATEDLTEGWDGTYKGEPVPSGNYSYVILYASEVSGFSVEDTYRGTLKLVR